MDEKTKQHIAELVATWPPLSDAVKAELDRLLNGPPDGPRIIISTAPLTCLLCSHGFTGRWFEQLTADQRCDGCGHVFEATWPGFHFEPETVILPREERA